MTTLNRMTAALGLFAATAFTACKKDDVRLSMKQIMPHHSSVPVASGSNNARPTIKTDTVYYGVGAFDQVTEDDSACHFILFTDLHDGQKTHYQLFGEATGVTDSLDYQVNYIGGGALLPSGTNVQRRDKVANNFSASANAMFILQNMHTHEKILMLPVPDSSVLSFAHLQNRTMTVAEAMDWSNNLMHAKGIGSIPRKLVIYRQP